jgi:hypothetical protein
VRATAWSADVPSMPMPSNEIYVQVTATPENGGPPKAVVVLVPRESLEDYKAQVRARSSNDQAIAQQLAEPLARNVFSHRAGFGPFRVAYSFASSPPPEIAGQSPEFRHGALKAWVL